MACNTVVHNVLECLEKYFVGVPRSRLARVPRHKVLGTRYLPLGI
jgi:hypothetical protein